MLLVLRVDRDIYVANRAIQGLFVWYWIQAIMGAYAGLFGDYDCGQDGGFMYGVMEGGGYGWAANQRAGRHPTMEAGLFHSGWV